MFLVDEIPDLWVREGDARTCSGEMSMHEGHVRTDTESFRLSASDFGGSVKQDAWPRGTS